MVEGPSGAQRHRPKWSGWQENLQQRTSASYSWRVGCKDGAKAQYHAPGYNSQVRPALLENRTTSASSSFCRFSHLQATAGTDPVRSTLGLPTIHSEGAVTVRTPPHYISCGLCVLTNTFNLMCGSSAFRYMPGKCVGQNLSTGMPATCTGVSTKSKSDAHAVLPYAAPPEYALPHQVDSRPSRPTFVTGPCFM